MKDWIYRRACLTPHRIAVRQAETEEQWSFSELNLRAEQLAQYLMNQGLQKGDRIALLAQNHISYLDLLFASAKIGSIFVPLNWQLTEAELSFVLQDCDPKMIVTQSRFAHKISGESAIILEWEELNESVYTLEQPINFLQDTLEQNDDEPLLMIYTGGTSGNPKGVVLTSDALFANAVNTIISWGLTEDDITLNCMPMFHTGGLNALTLPILLAGGTVVLAAQFNPKQAMIDLERYQCTIALFVPTMYHMMIQTAEFYQYSFRTMKVFLSGGAPCPFEIYQAFQKKGLAFKEGYGLSEAGPNNFYISPEDSQKKIGSVGKPMLFVQVKLMNDGVEVTEPNQVGELLISGNHTFLEYWKNETATKAAWKDHWLYSGDLARRDEEGYYYIVGRKKDMIISGGENVYPIEIEQRLLTHPAIEEAAVVGLMHEKWGEQVTAFLTVKGEDELIEQELQDYCAATLAAYKIPKQFTILHELPKTSVGKIDKKSLQKQVQQT